MSETNKALVVMYHYVRESRETSPQGIRPFLIGEFEKQLDRLERDFRIVSAEEFLHAVNNGSNSNGKPACLLTFDDGTRDHVEVVLPLLQRRSLPAVFFILTWPTEHQKMPVTHALHWVLGQPEEQVWAKLKHFAETKLGGDYALGSAEDALEKYRYEDTELRARIKYAVNFKLAPDAAQELIAEFADSQLKNLSELANEWFLTEQDIQQLYSCGMEIGLHGCSHLSLTQIGATGMQEEIFHGSSYLENLLGKAPNWFSPPFGGSDFKRDLTGIYQACRNVNVGAIVTTRKGFVSPNTNCYEIPRYDCIDLPPRSDTVLAA